MGQGWPMWKVYFSDFTGGIHTDLRILPVDFTGGILCEAFVDLRWRERESFIRNNLHNGVVSGAARGQALLGPMWAGLTPDSKGDPTGDEARARAAGGRPPSAAPAAQFPWPRHC